MDDYAWNPRSRPSDAFVRRIERSVRARRLRQPARAVRPIVVLPALCALLLAGALGRCTAVGDGARGAGAAPGTAVAAPTPPAVAPREHGATPATDAARSAGAKPDMPPAAGPRTER